MTTRRAKLGAVAVVMLTAVPTWAQDEKSAPPQPDLTEATEDVADAPDIEADDAAPAADDDATEQGADATGEPEMRRKKRRKPRRTRNEEESEATDRPDDERDESRRKPASAEPPPANWYRSPAYACPGCLDGGGPPPRRIEYHESMDVPDGFHLESTPRWGLIGAGIAVTGTLWGISVISAIALDSEASQEGDPNFDDMYWPMFIPVIGPFATIGTADSSGTGAAILALDGAIQAAGIAMVIGGFAAPTVEIVEDYKIQLTPVASKEQSGLNVSGSF